MSRISVVVAVIRLKKYGAVLTNMYVVPACYGLDV